MDFAIQLAAKEGWNPGLHDAECFFRGPRQPDPKTERLPAKGKVEGPMRPFHDGRHSSITNGAATGINPHALMTRAGHSDFKTTSLYIDLAGETSARRRRRSASGSSPQSGKKAGTTDRARRHLRKRKSRICGAFVYRGGRTRTCNPRFWRRAGRPRLA